MTENATVKWGLEGRRASQCGLCPHHAVTVRVRRIPGEAPMWVVQASGVVALVQRFLYSAFCLLRSSFPALAGPTDLLFARPHVLSAARVRQRST